MAVVLTARDLTRHYEVSRGLFKGHATVRALNGVSFELEPKGSDVLLTVIHRRLPDRKMLLMVAAGWHAHLDVLVARANGQPPAPFWDGWVRLRNEYDQRVPA